MRIAFSVNSGTSASAAMYGSTSGSAAASSLTDFVLSLRSRRAARAPPLASFLGGWRGRGLWRGARRRLRRRRRRRRRRSGRRRLARRGRSSGVGRRGFLRDLRELEGHPIALADRDVLLAILVAARERRRERP